LGHTVESNNGIMEMMVLTDDENGFRIPREFVCGWYSGVVELWGRGRRLYRLFELHGALQHTVVGHERCSQTPLISHAGARHLSAFRIKIVRICSHIMFTFRPANVVAIHAVIMTGRCRRHLVGQLPQTE